MVIAVDFDGTIVNHKYPDIGREIPGAIDTLKRLADEGHKLILWTVRDGDLLDEAIRFCEQRGLIFYAINANTPGDWSKETHRKIDADLFIDDCNIGGLPDWDQIYTMIHYRRTWADYVDYRSMGKRRRRKGPLARLHDRCREARHRLNNDERHLRARRHF